MRHFKGYQAFLEEYFSGKIDKSPKRLDISFNQVENSLADQESIMDTVDELLAQVDHNRVFSGVVQSSYGFYDGVRKTRTDLAILRGKSASHISQLFRQQVRGFHNLAVRNGKMSNLVIKLSNSRFLKDLLFYEKVQRDNFQSQLELAKQALKNNKPEYDQVNLMQLNNNEVSIDNFGLLWRSSTLLKRCGIHTIEDLRAFVTEKSLRSIINLGPVIEQEIIKKVIEPCEIIYEWDTKS